MSSIPYNYGSYIDAKVSMKDTGHVSAGKQIQSPASAGSRGLAKTTQFTNDRTQMQMGNSPIAESMVEIRNILNRIDGVNAPTEQPTDEAKSGITDANYKLLMMDISSMKDRIAELNIDDDSKTRALTALGDVEDELNFDESAVQEDDESYGYEWECSNCGTENQFDMTPQERAQYIKDWEADNQDLVADGETGLDALNNLLDTGAESGMHHGQKCIKCGTEATNPYQNEDISDKGRIALEKAGFDPMKVKEYMAVFNDHGDTSDIDQMNMDKVGLADAMAMVLASHDVENESYQPMPEGDEFDIEEDEDFEEVLGPLGFPEDETELFDAEYQGRKVPLNKPMRGDVKKFKVYVKDPKSGNVKKVNFGHGGTSAKRPTMRIRKSNPKARKSFRARHNCANPGPKTKARYWSCRKW